MDIDKKNQVLIAGFTPYGSGLVMNKIMKSYFKASNVINTSKMNILDIVKLVKVIKKKDITFQPSIAGYSWLRDIILSLVIDRYSNKKSLIVLCDLDYSKPNFISRFFMEKYLFNKSDEIYLPAEAMLFKKNTFKTPMRRLHHVSQHKQKVHLKKGNPFFLYANYLSSDKGINTFLSNFTNGVIIGNGRRIKVKKTFDLNVTRSKLEFDFAIKELSHKRPIFCYLSKYDLAPLLIQEIISFGIVIGVFKNSKSERILLNQFYKIDYVYLDDIDQNIIDVDTYDKLSEKNYYNFQNYRSNYIKTSNSKDLYIAI